MYKRSKVPFLFQNSKHTNFSGTGNTHTQSVSMCKNDNTKSNQSGSTVTPIDIPNHFAIVVDNAFDDETCDGFTTVTDGDLRDEFVIEANRRWLMEDPNLAGYFMEKIKKFLPSVWKGHKLHGLDSRFHLKRIPVGEISAPHFDTVLCTGSSSSYFSLVMCLNDNESGAGGDLKFFKYNDLGSDVVIAAKKGRVIIFEHTLLHTWLPVISGSRHLLRVDIMYENASVTAKRSYRSVTQELEVTPLRII